jgi:hypothetical protein
MRTQVDSESLRADRAEQRFNTLKGKYDAEVPRLSEELRVVKARNTDLEGQLAARPTPAAALPEVVTEEDLRLYGKPMVDLIEKIATRKAQDMVKQSGPQPAPAPAGAPAPEPAPTPAPAPADVEDAPDQEMLARYETQLTKLVPEWLKQNDDPKFMEWLKQRDPATGVNRWTILTRHHKALNAMKVAEVFLAFQGAREIGSRSDPLEKHLSPGTGDGDAPAGPIGGDAVWTRGKIKQFYTDCSLGKYKANPAEKKRIEDEIFAAQKAGRVTA